MCTEGIHAGADLILCNGQFEARHPPLAAAAAGSKSPATAVSTFSSGSPRLLWRRGRRDPARHGDFVLVNTNFSILNSLWQSLEQVTQIQVHGRIRPPEDPQSGRHLAGYIDFEQANREGPCMPRSATSRGDGRARNHRAPAPGEELARWDGLFRGIPNVSVIARAARAVDAGEPPAVAHVMPPPDSKRMSRATAALRPRAAAGWITGSLVSNLVNPVLGDPVAGGCRLPDSRRRRSAGRARRRAPARGLYIQLRGGRGDARIADLLVEGLPAAAPVALPALRDISRDERLKGKFSLSLEACQGAFERIASAFGARRPEVQALGDSLWRIGLQKAAVSAALPDYAQLRSAIEGGCQAAPSRRPTISQAELRRSASPRRLVRPRRHRALRARKYAAALQYFQSAAVRGSRRQLEHFVLARRTHQKLGELEPALRFAELAYGRRPCSRNISTWRRSCAFARKEAAKHWLMTAARTRATSAICSSTAPSFSGDRVHLECHEFAGARPTASASLDSRQRRAGGHAQAGARRMTQADRVLLYFGEIGLPPGGVEGGPGRRPVRFEQSDRRVRRRGCGSCRREICPHRSVLLLCAKRDRRRRRILQNASRTERSTVFAATLRHLPSACTLLSTCASYGGRRPGAFHAARRQSISRSTAARDPPASCARAACAWPPARAARIEAAEAVGRGAREIRGIRGAPGRRKTWRG